MTALTSKGGVGGGKSIPEEKEDVLGVTDRGENLRMRVFNRKRACVRGVRGRGSLLGGGQKLEKELLGRRIKKHGFVAHLHARTRAAHDQGAEDCDSEKLEKHW